MRVGLPRSLSFYYLFPLYRTFLSQIGVPWEETGYTRERDLTLLDLCPTDEPCISVRIAFVHAHNLLKKGLDCVFVPAVVSLSETAYCCPKMIGLPSMLKTGLGLNERQIVSPVIDLKENPGRWQRTWVKAARQMGVHDSARARHALAEGLKVLEQTEEYASVTSTPMSVLIDSGHKTPVLKGVAGNPGDNLPVTGVMGHGYILHDLFGKKIIQVVSSYGKVVMPESVSRAQTWECLKTIPDGEKAWTIEGKIMGAALHLLRAGKVDRMVFVSAFSCGPASIIENYIADEAEALGIPFLILAVDEHTGDAGLITRLEAFLDSIERRPARLGSAGGHVGKEGCPGAGSHGPRQTGSNQNRGVFDNGSCPTRGQAKPRRPDPLGLVSMGNLETPMVTLFTQMGVPVVLPPALTEDLVNKGKQLAPEFICYPMVTLLGQMQKLAEQGVRRIVMIQGKGRCRLGWYGQIMEGILQRAGYRVKVLTVDSPFPVGEKWASFVNSYKEIAGNPGTLKALKAAFMAIKKLQILDAAADKLRELRAFEKNRGEGERLFRKFEKDVDESKTPGEVKQAFSQYITKAGKVPRIPVVPVKVAVVGEIYVVNEPFVNKNVERILGTLEQRVRVYNNLGVFSWLASRLFKTPKAMANRRAINLAAAPYLNLEVGGHGLESVGETVLAAENGMDGALHLFPFTCMPEIIAQNILVKVSDHLDFPVLSLMISEQTGTQGLLTRLEAFCDLLAGRKKHRKMQG